LKQPPHYTLIDQPAQLAPLFAALDRVDEVALDTEADNLYHYHTRVCLLQILAGGEIHLVDLLANLPLADLWPRLQTKHLIMHGSDYDLRLLRGVCDFRPRSLFDTMFAAQLLNIPRFGLAALLEQYFGAKVDKDHQKANWSQRPLDRDMLDYAAQDVYFLPELRD
jgi:ribonuclease D